MRHKPYTTEWTRQKYLSESLSKYFEDGEPVDVVISDLTDILNDWLSDHQSKVEDIQVILETLNQ